MVNMVNISIGTKPEAVVFDLRGWFEPLFRRPISISTRAAVCIMLAAGLSRVANADLQLRLGGAAVYDTDLNITWLANANLAATNALVLSACIWASV